MKMRQFLLITAFLPALFFIAGCQRLKHPAEKAVSEMYDAISEGDMDAYMDAIHPENRNRPNLYGLFSAFSIGLGPVRANLDQLTQISFSEIRISVVEQVTDSYAIVQAEGLVRYPILLMEIPFCDQHDVKVHTDGKWYVDLYAPERTDRLQRLLELRHAELLEDGNMNSMQLDESFYTLFITGLTEGIDLCLDNIP